jgi:heme oxygenase
MDLDARLGSLPSYGKTLVRFRSLYSTLASRVDGFGLPFPQAMKVGWLDADLRHLGLSDPVLRGVCSGPGPEIAGRTDAYGVLYVLENATLGGQIIARRLHAALGVTATTGGRFFQSYGPEVGANWRRFVAMLDGSVEATAEGDRVERAALATFACFQALMEARDSPTAVPGADHDV